MFRKLLFPLSVIYRGITSFRNYLFDIDFLKSNSFDIPIISVGNLSTGGTGKTPQIEYLIRLLSDRYQIAVLSRGYKRKSKGFVLADNKANAQILGDEPYQIYQKFKNIQVAVDANRTHGIKQLLSLKEKPQIILLDDAFQHRKVKAGFSILLTSYADLYYNDFVLPMGNLRESKKGAKRANIIIVSKCPKYLSEHQQLKIRLKLRENHSQQIYFSFIDYDEFVFSEDDKILVSEIRKQPKLLLVGVANPKPFLKFLQSVNDYTIIYHDHHNFLENDLKLINNVSNDKIIVTTEKDYVRLKGANLSSKLYYLPIKTKFINSSKDFDKAILNYVITNINP